MAALSTCPGHPEPAQPFVQGQRQGDIGAAEDIRRLEDLEHPASHLALTRIAESLAVDVVEIDPGTA